MKYAVGFLAMLGASTAHAATDFEEALRAEARSLQAEAEALGGALREAESASRAAQQSLESDIEGLTAALARARADNAGRSERIPAGASAVSLEAETRRTEQILGRAKAWLTARSATVAETADIAEIVDRALAFVRRQGQLHIESGESFGPDGVARVGPLLRFGSVGAIARIDGDAMPPRPLVLADDGSLRAASVTQLARPADTGSGVLVDAVLQDPEDPSAVALAAEETLWDWLRRGGPIMWPLALLGLAAALLTLERIAALVLASIRVQRFERTLGLRGALSADGQAGKPPVEHAPQRPEPDILLAPAAIAHSADEPLARLEERTTDALYRARARLRRGLFFLAVVASVAPLVGLLGTVTGMIGTFRVITEHGTGDPRLLSAGISQALLTTQLGLTVAVPALLAHAILVRVANRILARLEALAVDGLRRRESNDDA
ncbi:MAG: MotA/TolQ/ExbB proton channel family protein [Myxococcota bacterium]